MYLSRILFSVLIGMSMTLPAFSAEIVHDGEFNFVQAQHQEAWAMQDKKIDARLADIRKAQGGKLDHLEGGVRVNAFARWPAAIEADSLAGYLKHGVRFHLHVQDAA